MNKETPTVKEKAIYQAVVDLFMEGADLSGLTVSEITAKAGIGKGTAYGYFSDKEEMIARSICYNVEQYCHWIYQGITEQKTLYEKIDFLLGKIEKEIILHRRFRKKCCNSLQGMLFPESSVMG